MEGGGEIWFLCFSWISFGQSSNYVGIGCRSNCVSCRFEVCSWEKRSANGGFHMQFDLFIAGLEIWKLSQEERGNDRVETL